MIRLILVIDDDQGIRDIIRFALEPVGWQVKTAPSGHEGLIQAQAQPPDAILLDVTMPDLDGYTVAHRLRSQATTQNIPIILLTARVQGHTPQQLAELKVAGVITKPFRVRELADKVKKLLQWTD
ncbi:two-component system response regulator [Leptolyngbya sp. 'hensonii']|uniref:response regulator n=1 Tax=Leptolyngbya sp. 'hensonii' TaxID=1922337 RepID=UPI000950243E|nr:response regulator [Leptolyngbya sp. 'hensonii']OLP15861.1 two-component system response regulator [Leptolyngbya sp. 'hensonii']